MDGSTIPVGILTQCTDVFHTIACRLAGTEAGSSDIYGICTMVDGSNAAC